MIENVVENTDTKKVYGDKFKNTAISFMTYSFMLPDSHIAKKFNAINKHWVTTDDYYTFKSSETFNNCLDNHKANDNFFWLTTNNFSQPI